MQVFVLHVHAACQTKQSALLNVERMLVNGPLAPKGRRPNSSKFTFAYNTSISNLTQLMGFSIDTLHTQTLVRTVYTHASACAHARTHTFAN
jgi:hypothetical protein